MCKYKLRATEQRLMAALGASSPADLELCLLAEARKAASPHGALIAAFHQQHRDLDAADRTFTAACELQRRRIADADDATQQLNRDLAALEC